MSEQPLFVTLDDLIASLVATGISQREAALQIKRELENALIFVLDPHRDPWSAEQVLRWQVQFLQSLADWKPGARLPSMQVGTADYLSHLRYCRIELKKGTARAGAGRPEQSDWEDAEMFAMELLRAKGDPANKLNQMKGWRSNTDLAKAVLEYLEKRAGKENTKAPELNTVRNRVPGWIKKYRTALN
jgi:hypothetical protein